MKPHCLITGCTLIFPNEDSWQSGDLYVIGDMYIFNAVGERNYDMDSGDRIYTKEIRFSHFADWFEKRNVYVFPKYYGMLNEGARKYLEGTNDSL